MSDLALVDGLLRICKVASVVMHVIEGSAGFCERCDAGRCLHVSVTLNWLAEHGGAGFPLMFLGIFLSMDRSPQFRHHVRKFLPLAGLQIM